MHLGPILHLCARGFLLPRGSPGWPASCPNLHCPQQCGLAADSHPGQPLAHVSSLNANVPKDSAAGAPPEAWASQAGASYSHTRSDRDGRPLAVTLGGTATHSPGELREAIQLVTLPWSGLGALTVEASRELPPHQGPLPGGLPVPSPKPHPGSPDPAIPTNIFCFHKHRAALEHEGVR